MNEAKLLKVDDRPLPAGSLVWHRLSNQLEYVEWLDKIKNVFTQYNMPPAEFIEEGDLSSQEDFPIAAPKPIEESFVFEVEGLEL